MDVGPRVSGCWGGRIVGPKDAHHGVRGCRNRLGAAVQAGASGLLAGKKTICLNIPDIYSYMEPALIDELKAALSGYVDLPG